MSNFLSLLSAAMLLIFPLTAHMTVQEKVGQLMMVFLQGEAVNEDAEILIRDLHVGGFIYYNWANGLENSGQVKKLSQGLQKLAKTHSPQIPLLIAIDQEGGRVARLRSGFFVPPSNREQARLGGSYVKRCAYKTALQLNAVGINMNLAPVVDVNSNEEASVLGDRTFSTDPKNVTHLAKQALEGYSKGGVIATLKHFPGYGSALVDPHLGLPVVRKTKEELETVDLYPFKELAKQADAIMSAHILMPAIDSDRCATISPIIIKDMLRDSCHYKGVVMTDSLTMQGILDACKTIDEAAIQAILAGHDIVLFGGKSLSDPNAKDLIVDDFKRIHGSLVQAVLDGRISNQRLDESVERILALKQKIIGISHVTK